MLHESEEEKSAVSIHSQEYFLTGTTIILKMCSLSFVHKFLTDKLMAKLLSLRLNACSQLIYTHSTNEETDTKNSNLKVLNCLLSSDPLPRHAHTLFSFRIPEGTSSCKVIMPLAGLLLSGQSFSYLKEETMSVSRDTAPQTMPGSGLSCHFIPQIVAVWTTALSFETQTLWASHLHSKPAFLTQEKLSFSRNSPQETCWFFFPFNSLHNSD